MADYKDQGRRAIAEAIEEAIDKHGMSPTEVHEEFVYILERRAEEEDDA